MRSTHQDTARSKFSTTRGQSQNSSRFIMRSRNRGADRNKSMMEPNYYQQSNTTTPRNIIEIAKPPEKPQTRALSPVNNIDEKHDDKNESNSVN